MTATIKLSTGETAYVDDDMADWLRQFKWHRIVPCKIMYARVNDPTAVGGVYMHRLIYPDAPAIDHINRNGLDNRRCNLRVVSQSINNLNVKPGKVWKRADCTFRPYQAQIRVNRRDIHLGCFTTEAVAKRVLELNRRRVIRGENIIRFVRGKWREHVQ